jgi:tetratricopeptide (TPR) repeat protein
MLCHLLVCIALVVSATANAENRAAAREAFRRASQHYKLGEYREALEEFKAAYREYEDPTFLFNIAQCERQLDMRSDAIRAYRMYLADAPDASNRDEVRQLIAKLEHEQAEERSTKAAPPANVIPPVSANKPQLAALPTPNALTRSAPPEKKPLVKRAWLWGTVAGAVVVIGAGVALGAVYGAPAKTFSPSLGAVQAN